jgi:hypothetical protein
LRIIGGCLLAVNHCLDLCQLADQLLLVIGSDASEQVIQELFVLGEYIGDEGSAFVGQGHVKNSAVGLALAAQNRPFFCSLSIT